MYALVHKNKVISGPRSWNREFFEFILKRRKIESGSIPKNPTENLPYQIDADTCIMSASVVRDELNPFIQHHRGPLWEIQGDIAIATYETVDTELEFAKANYKDFLADKRYEKEVAGTTVTVQDQEVSINTSREGKIAFYQHYSTMNENDVVNWKFVEGWLTLSKIEFGQVVQAITDHVQSAFDWEKEIGEQIDAEIALEDLVKYEEIISPKSESDVE